MPIGCIPIFGRGRCGGHRECDAELGAGTTSACTKYSLSVFSLPVVRKDSAITSGSVRSNSASISSISTRVSVSFNPQIEEMFFDKHEAPSHIRSLTSTKSRCPGIRQPAQRVNAFGQQFYLASRRRVERRHLIVQ